MMTTSHPTVVLNPYHQHPQERRLTASSFSNENAVPAFALQPQQQQQQQQQRRLSASNETASAVPSAWYGYGNYQTIPHSPARQQHGYTTYPQAATQAQAQSNLSASFYGMPASPVAAHSAVVADARSSINDSTARVVRDGPPLSPSAGTPTKKKKKGMVWKSIMPFSSSKPGSENSNGIPSSNSNKKEKTPSNESSDPFLYNLPTVTVNEQQMEGGHNNNNDSNPSQQTQEANGRDQSSSVTTDSAKPTNSKTALPQGIHPKKLEMKQDRKAKMAGCATTGAIVGAVLTGPAWPVGMAAGAAIGTYAGKVTARAGERRLQRKWEQKIFFEYHSKEKAGVQSESVAFA